MGAPNVRYALRPPGGAITFGDDLAAKPARGTCGCPTDDKSRYPWAAVSVCWRRRKGLSKEALVIVDRAMAATFILDVLPSLTSQGHETLGVLVMDGGGGALGVARLAEGGIASTSIYVREVLRPVLILNGTHFILFHNHPSLGFPGTLRASPEDTALTYRAEAAAGPLGLVLLDHLIFGPRSPGETATALEAPRMWSLDRRRAS